MGHFQGRHRCDKSYFHRDNARYEFSQILIQDNKKKSTQVFFVSEAFIYLFYCILQVRD